MVNLLVITHGEFGAYLVEAAEEIVGRQAEGVRVIGVSPRRSLAELRTAVERAVTELRSPEGLVIATDIPGGTPSNLVLPLVQDMPRAAVVSGLNLYMLVSAFNARARGAPLEEVAGRMLADAAKSIRDVKAALGAARTA